MRTPIIQFLKGELLGPVSQENEREVLRPQDPPRLRYSAGVLFPARIVVEQSDAASDAEVASANTGPAEGDEPEDVLPPAGPEIDSVESTDYEVNRANEFLPSAMGLSALVHLPAALQVTVRGARYEKLVVEGFGKQDRQGKWQPHYYRRPFKCRLQIDCAQFRQERPVVAEPRIYVDTGDPGLLLEFHVFSRPFRFSSDAERDRIITFSLINRSRPDSGNRDSRCVFQCEFEVSGEGGETPFLAYPSAENVAPDDEDASIRLLYRNRRTFAVGHGCAADWQSSGAAAASRIWTEVVPTHEIRPIVPRTLAGVDLSMKDLAEPGEPAVARCEALADAYRNWIEEQAAEVNTLPSEHTAAAQRQIGYCRDCLSRIQAGIRLLREDPAVRQAFAWMNRSMLLQQIHYELVVNSRREWTSERGRAFLAAPYSKPPEDVPPAGKGSWRAFQLAFILMNLDGIADASDVYRKVVDVIWFPTGGGKTEAYLGLTAFTIFHRRLKAKDNDGTTVLMRYTLRLLTTQQFQRAASLICACELIRRRANGRLGASCISIGLWVGAGVTPNRRTEAATAYRLLLREGKPNPFVILTCPWCGAAMGPLKVGNAYQAPGYVLQHGTVKFRCADPDCEFASNDGLPLHVVDDDIYAERPTLVIGTVDKFAMLPWNRDARSLFGIGHASGPPELIIQDELHLISGALGSMVGLYETTLEALCSVEGRRPKIVASTATIRRASEQVRSVYARSAFLFPPQGLDAGESFFGREAPDRAGRMYVGVFGSALSSHVTAQIRVLAALLQAPKSVAADSKQIDPYWTLVVYFNSLRELGHAATLIRADIREYLNAMWDRLNIRRPEPGQPDRRRFINRDIELTSRVSSSLIPEILQTLFEPYDGTVIDGKSQNHAVDVCLASNMIQVGLDVPRLGLLVSVGQPKTTSEYIQATSRVGRSDSGPGIVVTVYNASKPRDRSHYEHFRSYHESIYRWVEPTSVTPYAIPVRERALHAQIVALARYWDEALLDRPQAGPDAALRRRIKRTILDRVAVVDPDEAEATSSMIDVFFERWQRLAPPVYGGFGPPPDETPLMYPSGSEPLLVWANRALATPSSMRNVDSSCEAGVLADYPLE